MRIDRCGGHYGLSYMHMSSFVIYWANPKLSCIRYLVIKCGSGEANSVDTTVFWSLEVMMVYRTNLEIVYFKSLVHSYCSKVYSIQGTPRAVYLKTSYLIFRAVRPAVPIRVDKWIFLCVHVLRLRDLQTAFSTILHTRKYIWACVNKCNSQKYRNCGRVVIVTNVV